MEEQWKEIAGSKQYAVSSLGRVRSKFRILKQTISKKGYCKVHVRMMDGREVTDTVHRLVLLTFVGKPRQRHQCRHLDGNPQNNCLSNLRWGSVTENARDRKRHGTQAGGETHWKAVLSDAQVRQLIALRRESEASGQPITYKELARMFGISHTAAWRAVHRRPIYFKKPESQK